MLTSSLKTKVAKLENELCSQHKLARRWSLWLTFETTKKGKCAWPIRGRCVFMA
jgi:hypothetical protein